MEDLCFLVPQSYPTPRPHGLQHARLPCSSLPLRVCSNSSIESMMPFNHLILCFPFSSCPQSFPESGSFPMSWFFASGDQSIGASASASVLSLNNGILMSHKKSCHLKQHTRILSEINMSEEDQYHMILLICGI